MALDPLEREVLGEVRKRLVEVLGSKAYGHLCPQISDIGRENPHLWVACVRLRAYVSGQLDGLATLETWQSNNGFVTCYRNHIQDRLDWIDWMLE